MFLALGIESGKESFQNDNGPFIVLRGRHESLNIYITK